MFIIAFIAIGRMLGVEKQYTNIPELPPEIQYQIVQQIVNTARTRTEALKDLYNYAITNKMSADIVKESKKYLQSLLDQKFVLYKLAFSDYHDPVINKTVLDILEREKLTTRYPGPLNRFNMAISDIKHTSKEITSLSEYFYMLENAISDKKTVLAIIVLRFINQFKGTLDKNKLETINRLFGDTVKHAIDNIRNDPTNSNHFQVFDALIKTARRILPQEYLMYTRPISIYVPHNGRNWQDYSIFEYAQCSGTQETTDYLRGLGFDVFVEPVVKEAQEPVISNPTSQPFGYQYETMDI